jgi:hypothetical protein
MQVRHQIEGIMSYPVPANINDDTIPFDPTRDYIIPARLVKQLVDAAKPNPGPTDFQRMLDMLVAFGISYGCDNPSCGDSRVTQIWFSPPGGWELVFEFDAKTGAHLGFTLEER